MRRGVLTGGRTLGLSARASKGKARLPAAFFVTDPARTPDPERVAARLPPGTGIVYRAFGAADAEARGRRLMMIARRRGLVVLVGADAGLARRVGAHGVHLPERDGRSASRLKARNPSWIVTAAAHSAAAVRRARGADAVLLSPVFPSRSPSAGQPLGLMRFSSVARGARLPVYALGGATMKNAPRLCSAGASGVAAVDDFIA